ncbi:hypothetical protein [Bacillus sp. ISL-37]|uniref:hypothetical protein n=1 Tax=Bacillus sp. ISL-37 TaxID=2819123 RepID=UPI001BE92B50|nr:hypothetical protein [Bacillus sp. ISL-37]MBT2685166.1 hypothetical protein [Bacillus sp. ISL-37]
MRIYGKTFIYIGEWLLFLIALFYNLTLQLIFLGNIVLVDKNEEAASFPFSYSLIVVILGILFYFYIKHLQGSRRYRKVKEVIWGLFFTATAVSSLFWFSVNAVVYSQELLSNQVLLTIIFIVSAMLAVQIAIKYKREGSD